MPLRRARAIIPRCRGSARRTWHRTQRVLKSRVLTALKALVAATESGNNGRDMVSPRTARTMRKLARRSSIVELALRRAAGMSKTARSREERSAYVKSLVAPREPESDLQRVRTIESVKIPGGTREKVLFLSEIGEYIPALLWRPMLRNRPSC